MLYMKSEEVGVVLMQAAILTPTAGPFPDEGPQPGIHQLRSELARSWRALDFRMATNVL